MPKLVKSPKEPRTKKDEQPRQYFIVKTDSKDVPEHRPPEVVGVWAVSEDDAKMRVLLHYAAHCVTVVDAVPKRYSSRIGAI